MMKLGRWLSYIVLGKEAPGRRRTLHRSGWPLNDWRYRRFIRAKPCIACGATWGVEFAHTGPHGLDVKAPDSDGLPICFADHRTGDKALHKIGPERFQRLYALKFSSLIREFNSEWKEINQRRML